MTDAAVPANYQLKHFKYSSHYWILKILADEKRPLRILDVGTADGYMGAILKKQGHYLIGVERNTKLAAAARLHYDRFHHVDIEEFDFPYHEEFDYILFADVLEHLRDPAAVIGRSLGALKPTGKVILSVPNVANFVVRMGLLFGRFDYGDRGILDRTHLRFFTLASARRMIADLSCQVVDIFATPVPVQMVFPITNHVIFAPLHETHYLLTLLWKTMFAYQFVVRARPMSD